MKKNLKKVIVVMMLCILVINQLSMQLMASAAGGYNWGNQFIDSIELTDSSGKPIESVPTNQAFKIKYNFSIPNTIDVDQGDKMEVTLPKELQTAQNNELQFKDSNGELVAIGQATTKGGQQYVVTFTDYPERKSNVSGYFEFRVLFADDIKPGGEIEIEFDLPGGTVVVPITPEEPGGGIDPEKPIDGDQIYKKGTYLESANMIRWEIVIIPELLPNPAFPVLYESMSNVRVYDELGPGQEFAGLVNEDEVSVYKAYNYQGKSGVTYGNEWGQKVENYDAVNGKFEVDLGNIDDGMGRKILYNTRITDPDQVEFTNNARVVSTERTEDIGGKIRVEEGSGGAEGDNAGFTVVKQDDSGNALAGAKFDLYRVSNGNRTLIKENMESGSDGRISHDQTLKFGNYELEEVEAPDGYKLLDKPYAFELNEKGIKELEIPIINEKLETPVGSVELIKHDEADENKGLEGAEFDLFRGTPGSGTFVSSHVTPASGVIQVNNLEFGDYYFVETKAPAGYELDTTPRTFKIGEGQVTVPLELGVANKASQTPVGSVELIKYDEADESKGLAGAEFDLFRGTPGSGTFVSSHVTPASGVVQVNNLEFGNYYFVETKAPAGYELDTTPRTFTIGEGQVTVPLELGVANKASQTPVGSVELIKYDEADESKGLAGAEFDLFRGTPGS
ncbi:SpaA isopeptide-forming pilin-related protein, partial [Listeria booriae]|uniref:SpaA isopeptide-forming pilin-related protein n=1 Tax=Listeria booriae TaxID=1552123 RepID=UPI0016245F5D